MGTVLKTKKTKKMSEKDQFSTKTQVKCIKTPVFKNYKEKQRFYRLMSRSWWVTRTEKDGTIVKEQMIPKEREGQVKQHGVFDKLKLRKVNIKLKKENRKKNKNSKKQRIKNKS